jgi:hypothetical protein
MLGLPADGKATAVSKISSNVEDPSTVSPSAVTVPSTLRLVPNCPVVKLPAAAVVPPMTVLSMVPALMSAVVATRDASVATPVTPRVPETSTAPLISTVVVAI